jgi:uncharacterized protein YxjI
MPWVSADTPQADPAGRYRAGMRYAVRERIFSIGDDFWITDDRGDKAFLVDGKALRVRQTFELKDGSGAIVAVVRKKLIAMRETMEIEQGGEPVATVRKALVSPLRHRSVIELSDGSELEAVGNILDHEFEIRPSGGGAPLARISRAWFTMRDRYGVDVAPGLDDALVLAMAVALDRVEHDEAERH